MMRMRAGRAWLQNRNLLLFLVFLFSLLLFFGCLSLIPEEKSSPLLRGSAVLLSLCLPALFYLRSDNGEAFAFWKAEGRVASPLRLLPFGISMLLFGVCLAELMQVPSGQTLLFSRFAYAQAFSLDSLASALCYAFAGALLSFAFLGNQLASQGSVVSLVAPAFVFCSLAAAPLALPLLFVAGILLGIAQRLFGGIAASMLGTVALVLGGYFTSVGLLSASRFAFLERPVFLLVSALLCLALLFVAFYRAPIREALHSTVRTKKRPALLWGSFSLFVLLLSLFYSLFLTKWIG